MALTQAEVNQIADAVAARLLRADNLEKLAAALISRARGQQGRGPREPVLPPSGADG